MLPLRELKQVAQLLNTTKYRVQQTIQKHFLATLRLQSAFKAREERIEKENKQLEIET